VLQSLGDTCGTNPNEDTKMENDEWNNAVSASVSGTLIGIAVLFIPFSFGTSAALGAMGGLIYYLGARAAKGKSNNE
jgi:hypothetical protein